MGLDEGHVIAVPLAAAQQTSIDGCFVALLGAAPGLAPLLPKHGEIPEPPFWSYTRGVVAMHVGCGSLWPLCLVCLPCGQRCDGFGSATT